MKVAILVIDDREPHRNYHLPVPYFGAAPTALFEGLAALPEVEVHVVSCTQQPMVSPEKLADNIWFHSLHVPKIGWLRTLYQGCIRATRKKLNTIQPDIVHGQGTERNDAVGAVFSGYPNVLTIHGNMRAIAKSFHSRPGSFHWLTAHLETLALKRTNGVLCNSAYTESVVAPATKKTWRVANPVRQPFFDTPLPAPANNAPVLLNVGMLLAHKRQREILALGERLWRRGLKFELQFAGGIETKTAYGAAFVNELAAAEKAGYARHLGMLSGEKLIAAMDAATAMVHAPTEESFGLVVAEALARNLKLFATATGGVGDIATGVDGAELFPPADVAALEPAIANWMERGCPRPLNAAAVMRERYHPLVIARRHLEIYREVLGGKLKTET